MAERNSPFFREGLADGAADAARRPSERRGFAPDKARSWMYRRGFARAFLHLRRAAATIAPGCIDDRPAVIASMQQALDEIWAALDSAAQDKARP